ncbi:hypothetical protein AGMMS49556_10130 [Endomicrobiia bacterium]|nr:hypothetical protein AGMMS49556_10130 [Endomicrobiia bacterium]
MSTAFVIKYTTNATSLTSLQNSQGQYYLPSTTLDEIQDNSLAYGIAQHK